MQLRHAGVDQHARHAVGRDEGLRTPRDAWEQESHRHVDRVPAALKDRAVAKPLRGRVRHLIARTRRARAHRLENALVVRLHRLLADVVGVAVPVAVDRGAHVEPTVSVTAAPDARRAGDVEPFADVELEEPVFVQRHAAREPRASQRTKHVRREPPATRKWSGLLDAQRSDRHGVAPRTTLDHNDAHPGRGQSRGGEGPAESAADHQHVGVRHRASLAPHGSGNPRNSGGVKLDTRRGTDAPRRRTTEALPCPYHTAADSHGMASRAVPGEGRRKRHSDKPALRSRGARRGRRAGCRRCQNEHAAGGYVLHDLGTEIMSKSQIDRARTLAAMRVTRLRCGAT